MTLIEIKIPKGKNQIGLYELPSPKIIATNGDKLLLDRPNGSELRGAWRIILQEPLKPESALQSLDNINDVVAYHDGLQLGYNVFTLVDSEKRSMAIATTQIVPISNRVQRGVREGLGLIYHVDHNEEVSKSNQDYFMMKFYEELTKLLPYISEYPKHNCLGIVTESREESHHLEDIMEAGFRKLDLKKLKGKESIIPNGIVLLVSDILKDPNLELLAAETYMKYRHNKYQF